VQLGKGLQEEFEGDGMRKLMALAFIGFLCGMVLAGCSSLGQDTDHSSPIVQLVDKALGVAKDAQGNVTKSAPLDPTGGTIPIVSGVIGLASLAWYTIRKLSSSVPAATHDAAVAGLTNSNPATVTTSSTVPAAPGTPTV
jgi:hypothetical protein